MTSKTNRKDKKEEATAAIEEPVVQNPTEQAEATDQAETDQAVTVNPDEGYHFLIEKGEAAKINPKSQGRIFFQVAIKEEDQKLYLRIDSNEGGGLHSREWIELESLVHLLMAQGDSPFTSSLFKQVIKGRSSNNASFVAGILRSESMQLIQSSEKGLFQHQVHPQLDENYQRLVQLAATHNEKAS